MKMIYDLLYIKKDFVWAFDASKSPLVHCGFVICSRVFLFQILHAYTNIQTIL